MDAENYWTLANQVVAVAFAQTVAYAYALGTSDELKRNVARPAGCAAACVFTIAATAAYVVAVNSLWGWEQKFIDAGEAGKVIRETSRGAFNGRVVALILFGLFSVAVTLLQRVGAKWGE